MKRLLLTIVVLVTVLVPASVLAEEGNTQPIPLPHLGLPDPTPHYGELTPVYGVSPYGGGWHSFNEAPRTAGEIPYRSDGRRVLPIYDLKNTFDLNIGYVDGRNTEASTSLLYGNDAVGILPYGSVVYLGRYDGFDQGNGDFSAETCYVNVAQPDGTLHYQYRLKVIDHIYNTSLMVYMRTVEVHPSVAICTVIGDAITYP